MIYMLRKELEKLNAFSTPIPDILHSLSKSINNKNVNERMKLTIAVSELILYASQFRKNIRHWNGSLIPINAISFVIAPSGVG